MDSNDLRATNLSAPAWKTRRVEMKLAPDFKRRGARLLHQQCGLWGYDVRREVSGMRCNTLLEIGFTRTPPPQGVLGATTYARRETSGETVTLWGFGMHFGDEDGGIFLSRFAFWPRYSAQQAPERAWMPSQLKDTHRAPRRAGECLAALDYFRGALGWIANYEREIQARFGPRYRADALQLWHKTEAEFEAVHVARDWDELARDCGFGCHFVVRSKGRVECLGREAAA